LACQVRVLSNQGESEYGARRAAYIDVEGTEGDGRAGERSGVERSSSSSKGMKVNYSKTVPHKSSAIQIAKISTLIVWKQIKPKKCRPARWVKARRLPFISAPNDSMLVLAGEFLNRCKICAAARATDVVIVGNRTGQDRAKPYNNDCRQIGREHAYNPQNRQHNCS
jgi:hypothetical protein